MMRSIMNWLIKHKKEIERRTTVMEFSLANFVTDTSRSLPDTLTNEPKGDDRKKGICCLLNLLHLAIDSST